MLRPTKSQAINRIGRALAQIPSLMQLNSSAEDFIKWRRSAGVAVENAFGEDSRQVKEFQEVSFYSRYASYVNEGRNEIIAARAYSSGLSNSKALLENMIEEIEEYWADDSQTQPSFETQAMPDQLVSNRVFVVHGRNDGARNTVARFLESLELEPVILQELPSEGKTIIEKFEDHSAVGFAVVLCTPDDVGALASEPDNLRPRPRQNVVLELGFFLGKLGRNRVSALLDGDMEMPSDYGGVLYVPLDAAEGWKLTLARELNAAGLPLDMNRLLGG